MKASVRITAGAIGIAITLSLATTHGQEQASRKAVVPPPKADTTPNVSSGSATSAPGNLGRSPRKAHFEGRQGPPIAQPVCNNNHICKGSETSANCPGDCPSSCRSAGANGSTTWANTWSAWFESTCQACHGWNPITIRMNVDNGEDSILNRTKADPTGDVSRQPLNGGYIGDGTYNNLKCWIARGAPD